MMSASWTYNALKYTSTVLFSNISREVLAKSSNQKVSTSNPKNNCRGNSFQDTHFWFLCYFSFSFISRGYLSGRQSGQNFSTYIQKYWPNLAFLQNDKSSSNWNFLKKNIEEWRWRIWGSAIPSLPIAQRFTIPLSYVLDSWIPCKILLD